MDRYDALIFDCDGTLTNSMPVHYLCWSTVLARHGIDFSEERFYALGGMPTETIVRMLAEELGRPLDPVAITQEKEDAFLETLHALEPLAHVVEIARSNRGKKRLAVASGGIRRVIEAQLRQINCLDWFDAVITAEDTPRHKPHPDVFLEAAQRLGTPPERCCVYEDADLGIEAAKRAGMDWVDVRKMG